MLPEKRLEVRQEISAVLKKHDADRIDSLIILVELQKDIAQSMTGE